MHPVSSPPPYVATRIGTRARQLLSPGSQGQVLAGHSRAVYLRDSSGELLWLAPPDVPMHRRGVCLASWSLGPSSGGCYDVSDKMELTAPGLRLELGAVPSWDPPPVRIRQPHPPTDGLWHLHLAQAVLCDLPEPNGFGELLPAILCPSGHEQPPEPAWGYKASIGPDGAGAALAVAQACQDGDLPRILSHAQGLVGLGEGLTPSGDDFLGGVLFGLSALTPGDGEDARCPGVNIREFLQWSRQRTNVVSSQFLQDHAWGHGCDVLEQFARGLLERWPARAIVPSARALIGLGHSTGWSLMAGTWTALALFPSKQDQTLQLESSAGIPALG